MIKIKFTGLDERYNFSQQKPGKEHIVEYEITIERKDGSSVYAGSAKIGEEIQISHKMIEGDE